MGEESGRLVVAEGEAVLEFRRELEVELWVGVDLVGKKRGMVRAATLRPVMARAPRRRVRGEMMKPCWGAGGMGTFYTLMTNQ